MSVSVCLSVCLMRCLDFMLYKGMGLNSTDPKCCLRLMCVSPCPLQMCAKSLSLVNV